MLLFLSLLWCSLLPATDLMLSPNDQRLAVAKTLSNGIQVIAIQDHEANAGVVALYERGSLEDPKGCPGLAHLLEHMIFIKNKHDQEVDSLSKFITSHNGFTNAMTSPSATTYLFEIEPLFLEELVDRAAKSLLAPDFDKKFVKLEVMSVNSEWERNKSDTFRVARDLMLQRCQPTHPLSRFHIGNKQTLIPYAHGEKKLAKNLTKFYQDHYGSNTLSLGIYGPYPPDYMIDMLEKSFASSKPSAALPVAIQSELYAPNDRSTLFSYSLDKEEFMTIIAIPIEKMSLEKKKALEYVMSHLTQSVHAGSFKDVIKQQGYPADLGYFIEQHRDFGVLWLIFDQPCECRDKTEEILGLLHAALEQELQSVDLNYVENEKSRKGQEWVVNRPKTTCYALSDALEAMPYYPIEQVMVYGYLDAMNAEHVELSRIKDDLLSTNRWIIATSVAQPTKEMLKNTSRYGAHYVEQPISIGKASKVFTRSEKSLYNVKDFTVIEVPNMESPITVKSEQGHEMAFWSNDRYAQPRVGITLHLQKVHSLWRRFQELFLVDVLNHAQERLTDDFAQAGFQINVDHRVSDTVVTFMGSRDNLSVLLSKAKEYFLAPLDADTFERCKVAKLNALKTMVDGDSSSFHNRLRNIAGDALSLEELIAATDLMSLEDLTKVQLQLFKGHAKVFIGGNLTQSEGLQYLEDIYHIFPIEEDANPIKADTKTVENSGTTSVRKTIEQTYSSIKPETIVAHCYEFTLNPNNKVAIDARLSMLEALLGSHAFEYLRTREQLGYATSLHHYNHQQIRNKAGLLLFVQSDRFKSETISEVMTRFMLHATSILRDTSPETFKEVQTSLAQQALRPDASLAAEYVFLRSQFLLQEPQYNYNSLWAEAVEQITQEELIEFFEKMYAGVGENSFYKITIGQ